MLQWVSSNSKAKKTLRFLVAGFIVLFVFTVYSRSDFRNDGKTNFLSLQRTVTNDIMNENRSFYGNTKKNVAINEELNISLKLINDKSTAKKPKFINKNVYRNSKSKQRKPNTVDEVANKLSSEIEFVNDTGVYFIDNQVSQKFQQHARQVNTNEWYKFTRKKYSPKFAPLAFKRLQQKLRIQQGLSSYLMKADKSAFDIMSMTPINYDSAYKNPCWRGDSENGPFKDGKLHCLPYFYLIGVKKSGTTDFMSRLSKHPDYCKPSFGKESQWFARLRFATALHLASRYSYILKKYDIRRIEFYSSMFGNAVSCISQQPSIKGQNSVYYRRITADAAPSTFHMHTNWELLPGNEDLTEPRFTNFHYMKHLTPEVKIIILLRDPSTRLYSDFLHSTRGSYGYDTPGMFHSQVLTLIKAYKDCFSQSTERSCVYNNTLKKELRKKSIDIHGSFNAGFYAVFMTDMLSVFGSDKILPIFMPDYVTNMKETLKKAFSFLDMAEVSAEKMKLMLQSRRRNTSVKKSSAPIEMLSKTREILNEFYRPYNEEMAALMNDKRYLFRNVA